MFPTPGTLHLGLRSLNP